MLIPSLLTPPRLQSDGNSFSRQRPLRQLREHIRRTVHRGADMVHYSGFLPAGFFETSSLLVAEWLVRAVVIKGRRPVNIGTLV